MLKLRATGVSGSHRCAPGNAERKRTGAVLGGANGAAMAGAMDGDMVWARGQGEGRAIALSWCSVGAHSAFIRCTIDEWKIFGANRRRRVMVDVI
jgi:hypothetical protein